MHKCPPPIAALTAWLQDRSSGAGQYEHLLLEQQVQTEASLIAALRPYFESAHSDARAVFHEFAAIDLHPDADGAGAHAQYPACLPSTARRGLFGEVMAGLIVESYTLVGSYSWRVPVFLFRYHADVERYMFDLARDPTRRRAVFGRFGNDFIAIALDDQGAVVRFMAGEAKWRDTVTPAVIDELMHGEWTEDPPGSGNRVRSGRGVWFELNRGLPVPHGLRQLQRLLIELAPDEFAAAILSMDRVLALRDAAPMPRCDLVVIAGDRGAKRVAGTALLPTTAAPAEYTAGREIQVVELVLQGGGTLIDALYDSLWSAADSDATAEQ